MRTPTFERRYDHLRRMVDRRLASVICPGKADDMHMACHYVLSGGGKRVRSILLLLACEAVGGNVRRALNAGAAIEILHDFTLVHDDIMDNAPSRRGRQTVHVRWDHNTAILLGDVLLGIAYRMLLKTDDVHTHELVDVFTAGLLDVCEGQALDLAFERRENVTVHDYFTMIEKKTGRLITTATELGALIGGATARQHDALRQFSHHLGRAFQLQDDLLDVIADQRRFGKSIGGDIIEGKKTFLLLTAAERASARDRRVIEQALHCRDRERHPLSLRRRQRIIADVTAIYRRYGVLDEARALIARDTRQATAALARLPDTAATRMLQWLSGMLLHRAA